MHPRHHHQDNRVVRLRGPTLFAVVDRSLSYLSDSLPAQLATVRTRDQNPRTHHFQNKDPPDSV